MRIIKKKLIDEYLIDCFNKLTSTAERMENAITLND